MRKSPLGVRYASIAKQQSGFTLVEVMLVVAIMLLVFVPAFNAFQLAHKTWSYTEASNPSIIEAKAALTQISQDLRQACQPSSIEKPVIIEDSGQCLILYKYNGSANEWEKIGYQVANNILSRIVLADTDPAAAIAAAIPGSSDPGWNKMLAGITSSPVFALDDNNNPRIASISLQLADTQAKPRFQPFTVASSYTIRSREVGSIHGEPVPDASNPPTVAVVKVELSPTELILYTTKEPKSGSVRADIWPANATNKKSSWASSNINIVVVEYDEDNSTAAIVKVAPGCTVVGNSTKTANVTATSDCGGKKATCKVTVKK